MFHIPVECRFVGSDLSNDGLRGVQAAFSGLAGFSPT